MALANPTVGTVIGVALIVVLVLVVIEFLARPPAATAAPSTPEQQVSSHG